jgi:hypothetical protein
MGVLSQGILEAIGIWWVRDGICLIFIAAADKTVKCCTIWPGTRCFVKDLGRNIVRL